MYWVLMLGHQQSVEMDPGRESNGRHTLFLSSYVVEAMILLHQNSVSSLPPNELELPKSLYQHDDTHLYFTKDGRAQNGYHTQVIVLENPRTIRRYMDVFCQSAINDP